MPVRTVLFDLDGTLIDSHRLIIASFRHACRQVLGHDVTDENAQVRWGQPLAVRFAAVAPDRVPALLDAYAEYYDRHERTLASVFPGVPELLAALTGRACAIGVVTSKRGRAAVQALRVLGLAQWITAVGRRGGCAGAEARRPTRYGKRSVASRRSPESALMVGDGSLRHPGGPGRGRAKRGRALGHRGRRNVARVPPRLRRALAWRGRGARRVRVDDRPAHREAHLRRPDGRAVSGSLDAYRERADLHHVLDPVAEVGRANDAPAQRAVRRQSPALQAGRTRAHGGRSPPPWRRHGQHVRIAPVQQPHPRRPGPRRATISPGRKLAAPTNAGDHGVDRPLVQLARRRRSGRAAPRAAP